ncbi:MAG TPA: protease pro-enzyme activation domain-containing protein [Candidatus Binataceae bacterium]|nr:protease pro-enzyme activation domain-containing protein [Candidatus Binataceae bacterium]
MRKNRITLLIGVAALMCFTVARGQCADTVHLMGNHPREAEGFANKPDADPARVLSMQIRFTPRNQSELNQLLADQQNPASPNFHKWLKTGEFDQRFGPSQSEIDAVADWLRSEGFTVESTSDGYIAFSGTVAQAERAFATRIVAFDDGKTYANLTDPTIPARFAGVIGNILGLDNTMHAVPVAPHRIAPTVN